MTAAAGKYPLSPESGTLLVHTGRSGLGAKVGHDLTLAPERWWGTATVDPADATACAVSVEVEVASLRVVDGTGGVKPLTDSDRAEIEQTLRTKILHTDRHPNLEFRSTRVEGTAERFTVHGDLTIVGVTQPVAVQGSLADGKARGSARVRQTSFGIKPYSALFGALKLADEVEVSFDLTLQAG